MILMKIKKGDKVVVIKGKDRAKTGAVIKVLPELKRVVVEGVNLAVKYQKAERGSKKAERMNVPMPFAVANVKLVCSHCQKATRVGYQVAGEVKSRVCKQCHKTI